MATKIQRLCDFHLVKKDEEVPGTTRRVPINYKKTTIDACDDCYAEHFEIPLGIMRDLLEELGARADDAPSQPPLDQPVRKKITCPEPECDYTVGSRTSFRTHMPDVHGVPLAVWEGRKGKSIEGEPIEHYCDEEGCEAGFTTPQGKGAHMASEHGYTGPDSIKRPRQEQLPQQPAKKPTAKKTAKKAS